ncbi:MoxR-like ATPase [Thiocystis violascens DSM 198]|uniref:MoxR-like ATPase n=2 Tax=Thiocystis violascens TaxID=73141 RepID=I3YAK7_THIV6|nr:MoxR-like ATPase [Thiocystis violascens DSM 198]
MLAPPARPESTTAHGTHGNHPSMTTPSELQPVRDHIASRIIGQQPFIDSMLVCLLSDGHLLVEGMPGLAKTTAVKALAESLEGDFHRIQFTPDLLPSDLIGTDIYRHEKGEFEFRQGPLFHNLLLADEVNRAPAKVQSALLEAMAEHQITVGQRTYPLPKLFMVLATQNPVEQEGTYHLPEAQLDRFLMQAVVTYPTRDEEIKILELDSQQQTQSHAPPIKPLTQEELFAMRRDVAGLYLDPKLHSYIVDLVQATRQPKRYDRDLGRWCRFGASPRASIALARCARARAWLDGDTFVTPQHIQSVAPEILRHRILLTFEAEAEGVTTDAFVNRLLTLVAIP